MAPINDEHKCGNCDGTGTYELNIKGIEYRKFTCHDCHGDGYERMTITRQQYDSLMEYKAMYEGLCK